MTELSTIMKFAAMLGYVVMDIVLAKAILLHRRERLNREKKGGETDA